MTECLLCYNTSPTVVYRDNLEHTDYMNTTQTITFLADLTTDQRCDLHTAIYAAYTACRSDDYSAFAWRKSPTTSGRYSLLIEGTQVGWVIKDGRKWTAIAANANGPGTTVFDDLVSRNEAGHEIVRYQDRNMVI